MNEPSAPEGHLMRTRSVRLPAQRKQAKRACSNNICTGRIVRQTKGIFGWTLHKGRGVAKVVFLWTQFSKMRTATDSKYLCK